jgi:DnaK suppressor protein
LDIAHFEKKLRDKLADLEAQMNRLRKEARDNDDAGVRDPIDQAIDSQISGDAAAESKRAQANMEKVRNALDRIAAGTYGKCLNCGRDIESARLEAVPWAEYCLKDQELLERATNP